jgi:hypothetical protein
MIDWNEDNFLEKLTLQVQQESGGAVGPCPDAETPCAVIEGKARGPERDAVVEHLSQCATCDEVYPQSNRFPAAIKKIAPVSQFGAQKNDLQAKIQ